MYFCLWFANFFLTSITKKPVTTVPWDQSLTVLTFKRANWKPANLAPVIPASGIREHRGRTLDAERVFPLLRLVRPGNGGLLLEDDLVGLDRGHGHHDVADAIPVLNPELAALVLNFGVNTILTTD